MLFLQLIKIQIKNLLLDPSGFYWRLIMLCNFRTYKLSVQFYKNCKSLSLAGNLNSQLLRASSSIALNLAEGSGRRTIRDRLRFYHIAMGSLRECQAVLTILSKEELLVEADIVGAHLYKLINSQVSYR